MRNNLNREVLLSVVAEWLEELEIPSVIPREGFSVDLQDLNHILAIVGPRRAGKTYFMYQLIQSLIASGKYSKEDILFLDFEDYRLTGFSDTDIERLLEVFHQLTGRFPAFLFFDEIQHLKNWSRVLRTLHNRRKFKIVVSGSNSDLLGQEVATELRGRYCDVLLLPFSFREFLKARGTSFSTPSIYTPLRGNLLSLFDDFIRYGGFPEVIMSRRESEKRKLLQSYFKTTFYKDILERYNIKARYILDALMAEFLETFSSIFSISQFESYLKKNGLAGSKRTIANYLHYLEEAFFIILSEKFSFSPRKRIMNPKKVYLIDTGFAVLGGSFSENKGRLLENLVAIELLRRGKEIYYFKDKNECDFLIKGDRKISSAIQVCWALNERNKKREVAGLIKACWEFGLRRGYIFTYEREGVEKEGGVEIRIVPVWKWLLLDNIPELSFST